QQDQFVVWQPGAVTGIAALVGSQALDAWKDYLAFHAIDRASPFLSRAFVDENFSFYGSTLSGTPEQAPRWRRGVDATNGSLGGGGGPPLRRAALPRGIQTGDGATGPEPDDGLRRTHRPAGMDVGRDPRRRPTQVADPGRLHRPSRAVAGLQQPGNPQRSGVG